MANTVWDLLADRVRRRPADPLLTYVDAEGQRTELSARTLANNVAKAAGALRDEAMLDPGARVAIRLPWHWQRPVWLLACWCVGVVATETADTADADLLLTTADRPAPPGIEAWAVSLHPFGLPLPDVPSGMQDAATITRLQPDAFLADPVPADAEAFVLGSTSWTLAQLAEAAGGLAEAAGVRAGDRVAVADGEGLAGALWGTLAALVADASVVMVGPGADAEAVSRTESARLQP